MKNDLEPKDKYAAIVIVAAAVVLLLGAFRFSPPMLQFGYDPVSPRPFEEVLLVQMDLNTAGETALCNLPGIGPKKAAAIIKYRAEHGAFSRVDELILVEGITQNDIDALRPYILIE